MESATAVRLARLHPLSPQGRDSIAVLVAGALAALSLVDRTDRCFPYCGDPTPVKADITYWQFSATELGFSMLLFSFGMIMPALLREGLQRHGTWPRLAAAWLPGPLFAMALSACAIGFTPWTTALGWSELRLNVLMFLGTMAAFAAFRAPPEGLWASIPPGRIRCLTLSLRWAGYLALGWIMLFLLFFAGTSEASANRADYWWLRGAASLAWAFPVSALAFAILRSSRTAMIAWVCGIFAALTLDRLTNLIPYHPGALAAWRDTIALYTFVISSGALLGSVLADPSSRSPKAQRWFAFILCVSGFWGALLFEGLPLSPRLSIPVRSLQYAAISAGAWLAAAGVSAVLAGRGRAIAGLRSVLRNAPLIYLLMGAWPWVDARLPYMHPFPLPRPAEEMWLQYGKPLGAGIFCCLLAHAFNCFGFGLALAPPAVTEQQPG